MTVGYQVGIGRGVGLRSVRRAGRTIHLKLFYVVPRTGHHAQ